MRHVRQLLIVPYLLLSTISAAQTPPAEPTDEAADREALLEMVEQLRRERDELQAQVQQAKPLRQYPQPNKIGIIPIVGMIGIEATADAIKKELDRIEAAKADCVVLYVDSTGGSVEEMNKIISLIENSDGVSFVAYVKQAISAAAVISVTAERIIMSPGAVIGGAVPYKMNAQGVPEEVEEKMRSIFRAQVRRAAAVGGHSPLLAQGMEDPELQLSVIEDPSNPPVVMEGTSQGRLLKPRGKVLTLTANEAVACGLADAISTDDDFLSLINPINPDIANAKTWQSVYVAGLRKRLDQVDGAIARVQGTLMNIRKAYAQTNSAIRAKNSGRAQNRRAEQAELDAKFKPLREQGEQYLRTLKEQRQQINVAIKKATTGGGPFPSTPREAASTRPAPRAPARR